MDGVDGLDGLDHLGALISRFPLFRAFCYIARHENSHGRQ